MEEPEEQTHSFVIRLWLEEMDKEADRGIWRGHITHVTSGECRYLKDLNSITAFIAPYLEGMGRQFGMGGQFRRWLLTRLLH